jgi:hypothetical protein
MWTYVAHIIQCTTYAYQFSEKSPSVSSKILVLNGSYHHLYNSGWYMLWNMAYKITRLLFLTNCAVGVIKIFIQFKNERKVPLIKISRLLFREEGSLFSAYTWMLF